MVDYSKWKNIEISDDEDETHPNIDTPSLFRWRHEARMQRMNELQAEKDALKLRIQSNKARVLEIKKRLENKEEDENNLKMQLDKLTIESKELSKEEEKFNKKEKTMPWNVDTISKPGFEKTVLNKQLLNKSETELTPEQSEEELRIFIKENEAQCKKYGMLQKFEDSKRFLLANPNLVSENTTNYLVIWSISLQMEEKKDLMAHVAHQCICMQYILELAKSLKVDPRACVNSFFSKIQNCAPDYRKDFENEIESFKKRIIARAEEKIQEAIAEMENESREARLGPGGLDPVEVFESLPEEMQECFNKRDIELLKKTIQTMSTEDAKYHMKRCVDSGLWLPNSKADEEILMDENEVSQTNPSTLA